MFDPKKLLDDLLGSKIPGTESTVRDKAGQATQLAKDNPLAAGALVAVLLGTGTGRKVTGSALKIGGLAAVAGLAYKAYRNYQKGNQPGAASEPGAEQEPVLLPPPSDTEFDPAQAPQGEAEFTLAIVRAMIAAAKADGHVDAQEQARIFAEMDKLPLSADDKAFVMDELRAKLDVDAVAGAAATPEEAAEIYAASLLSIDVDNAAERGYLAMLAARLKLDEGLVAHLHGNVAAATVKASCSVRMRAEPSSATATALAARRILGLALAPTPSAFSQIASTASSGSDDFFSVIIRSRPSMLPAPRSSRSLSATR